MFQSVNTRCFIRDRNMIQRVFIVFHKIFECFSGQFTFTIYSLRP